MTTFQWMRIPDKQTAGQTTSDTTEVEIGSGIELPTWARSIVAVQAHMVLLALTSDEIVSGYIKLENDEGTVKPFNFPLPISIALTGAIATHRSSCLIQVPCFNPVTKKDTLHAYTALDGATTGAHTVQVYVLVSDGDVPFTMHAEKAAYTAGSATANAAGTAVDISTIEAKCSAVLGMMGYVGAGAITAAQTVGGNITMVSNEKGWIDQSIPSNMYASGLSTAIEPRTKPVACLVPTLKEFLEEVYYFPFLYPFRMDGKGTWTFNTYQDGTNTNAPSYRPFLFYRE